jgi:DNA-binding NarL/FixJ family response regulator
MTDITTRILLVDDHQIVRQGLFSLLSAESDFRVVADAGDGSEALRLLERWRPDVMIVDIGMPGINGIEVTRQAAHISPHTRVIILSMYDDMAHVAEALKYGACSYVLKGESTDQLVRAVRQTMQGMRYLSAPITQESVDDYIARAKGRGGDSYESLTGREREVLILTAQGCTSQIIASKLYISPRTVESHRANLLRKLNITSHSDLIRYALERNLVKTSSAV